MKGRGEAGGAVSIVNAISIGRGASLGIQLKTTAEIELIDDPVYTLSINGEPGDPTLVKAVVEVFSRILDIKVSGARVATFSNIPMAVGLKSSSSAAVAIAKAFLNATGQTMYTEEFLKLVAEASILSRTSITGAMDDAAACLLGGIAVTDNLKRLIISHRTVEQELMTVILVPPGQIYTGSFRPELLAPVKQMVETAFGLALMGDYWTAMTINGMAHSAALGLPVQPAVEALRSGALAAGLSGTGPAIAAVATEESVDKVAEAFARFEGKVITCRVNKGALG
ncbi:MAG: shikimate kinase [Candidatus Caldarchaeum sp.]